jgi:hypothetical protein
MGPANRLGPPPDWTGAERDRIRQLTAEKYGRDGWNRKR